MTAEHLEPDELAPADEPIEHADRAARAHVVVAVVFLLLSLADLIAAAIQLVAPEFLGGIAFLSYGRLQPMAVSGLLFGWLTIGLLGAIYFILPRATGGKLRSEGLASASLLLLVVGFAAGIVGIGLGMSEGRRYAEMPLWADAVSLVGLFLATVVVTRTVRDGDRENLNPIQWYLVAAVHWLFLGHLVGNIPGLSGLSSTFQTSFLRASLVGLWVGAAGIGVVYYLIPKLTGRDAFRATQLSALGFWSLAFLWALSAPGELTYSPGPDWLDTLGVLFSIALFVPVATIFADIVTAMRGRWGEIRDGVTMRFVMAGAVAFALLPLLNLAHALRTSGAIVGLTSWVTGYEYVAFLGAGSLWVMAFAHHAAPKLFKGGGTSSNRLVHYNGTLIGVVVAAGAVLFAGVQTGFLWASSANSAKFANVGEGFINTVRAMEGPNLVRLGGLVIFALAQLVFVYALFRRQPGSEAALSRPAEGEHEDTAIELTEDLQLARPVGLRKLQVGYVGLFVVAAVLVLILPSLEGDQAEPTILADAHRFYPEGAPATLGREVYIAEGCVQCHTQMVRPIVTDVGLGPVSQPGDYARETPVQLGWVRIGPDLMHAATLELTEGAGNVADHLRNPRLLRPWSTMPSYDYLSEADLNALAAYILTLDAVTFVDEPVDEMSE